MKVKNIVSCVLVVFALISNGQSNSTLSATLSAKIDSVVNAWLKKNGGVGASIGIVNNGQIAYAKGFGYSDSAKKLKVSEKTIFRVGSITKSFTALAVMQLYREGKLDINSSIKRYLPELTIKSRFNDGNELLIKDILSHTSGLPGDIQNGHNCLHPKGIWHIVDLFNQEGFTSHPKSFVHAYSNEGYDILGCLIERVSGIKYDAYIKEKILDVIGMPMSGIYLSESMQKEYSKAYDETGALDEPAFTDIPAGLLHSNTIDMCQFMRCLLNNGRIENRQIIDEQSLKDMMSSKTSGLELQKYDFLDWGYGFITQKIKYTNGDTDRISGHAGDTKSYHSNYFILSKAKMGISIMTNSSNLSGKTNGLMIKLLHLILKEEKKLNWDKNSERPPYYTRQPSFKNIVGQYNAIESMVTIKGRAHKLKMKQGKYHFVLKRTKDSTYQGYVKLARLIPIKAKGLVIGFEEINSESYMKMISKKGVSEEYMVKKSVMASEADISDWTKLLGHYQIINLIPGCKENPLEHVKLFMNKTTLVLELTKISSKGKTEKTSTYYDILTNKTAVSGGLGRSSNQILRILENGNLYSQGFELKKITKP
jgi:CubicO group peptidase (beta-lactamase class C family)